MIVYIAGPMSGLPEFNYPAFNEVAEVLRRAGLQVENPAENPDQQTWLDYMRLSLRQISRADAVLMLEGWQRSRGAAIEQRLAEMLGLQVFYSLEGLLSASASVTHATEQV